MSPESNPELFNKLAEPSMGNLNEEYMRRNLVAGVLKDASELFEDRQTTRHPITEPSLFARFYALSQVQRTNLGVTGFNPLRVVRFEEGVVSLEAKSAPHHDEVELQDGPTLRTRLINITVPEPSYASDTGGLSWNHEQQTKTQDGDIEIFGINIYYPDTEIDDIFADADQQPRKRLAIVSRSGEVRDKPQPITGETIIFGVRNRRTNDAKLYTITPLKSDDVEDTAFIASPSHKQDGSSIVRLPDGVYMVVRSLSGDDLRGAVEEIERGVRALQNGESCDSQLSPEERQAVGSAFEPRPPEE